MTKEFIPEYRLRDPGKAIGQCDGYFDPSGNQRHGPMRINKSAQDRMPVDQRPRVIEAKRRAKRMKESGNA